MKNNTKAPKLPKLTANQSKSLSKIVKLPKKATLFDAWSELQRLGYEAAVNHSLKGGFGDRRNYIKVELTKDGKEVKTFAIDGTTAEEIVASDFDAIYGVLVDGVISSISRKNKKIKTVLKEVEEEPVVEIKKTMRSLDELTTLRNKLTMKIYHWKKDGKDTTTLESEKESIVKEIEMVRKAKSNKKK